MQLDEMWAPGNAVFLVISKFIGSFFGPPPPEDELDRRLLNELGYAQELRRVLTLWSVFCLSFSAVGILSSMAATLAFSLGLFLSILLVKCRYAGTGGLVWGWIIAALMSQCLALSIAELCSSYPTIVLNFYFMCLF